MKKKILISTGGTGGHVFPAMALAQQLSQEFNNCEILFVGGGLNDNRYFDRNSFASKTIDCATIKSKNPWNIFKSLSKIGKGICQSIKLIRNFQPDIIVGFGSFYSFPPLIAAKMLSIPMVLHEANSIPGKVNKILSKYATASTVHFPETLRLLKGKTIEVGMPLRKELISSNYSNEMAKQHYGLDPKAPVILIFGGSQGAKIINSVAFESIKIVNEQLRASSPALQVIHLTGSLTSHEQLQESYTNNHISAVVKPFETDMAKAWKAADVVISRSGASTIAEQLEFEVPGILIPFAAAAENHQEHNANFMVKDIGGAWMLKENELTPNSLARLLHEIVQGKNLNSMCELMKNYKKTSRTQDLCSVIKGILSI